MMDEYKLALPKSWTKKLKNENLLDELSNIALWASLPDPTTADGREVLKFNERLLLFADKQQEEFAMEPYGNVFEFIPSSVRHQGAGVSVFEQQPGMLRVDVYFFPCDYSEDPSRHLPPWAVRQSVFASDSDEFIQDFADKYILTGPKSLIKDYDTCCAIPFSPDKVAVLEGNFIDHYSETKKICQAVVKGGSDEEYNNCKRFLEFIKNVGR